MFRNHKEMHSGFYDPKFLKSAKKKKSHGNFGVYCSKLMKHSLITGFSVIAASRSTLRRAVKLFVLLICTGGFFYQTYSFLQIYLEYPTILDISMQHPESVNAPAVTICNRNRLLRQLFCDAFHDNCRWNINTWEDFCTYYPMYCPSIKPSEFSFGVPESRVLINQNRTNAVLNTVGPQAESDLIDGCSIKGVNEARPCNASIMIQAAKDGYPYKCFTLLSVVNTPSKDPTNVTLTDEYNIWLDMHPEEYMKFQDLIQAYVFVHDPRSISNPMAEGVTLKTGKIHKLYLTMQKRESLPPPYKSNCTDYISLWKKNGGFGPITKRECTDVCKIKAMVDAFGCVGQTITYPNNYPICADSTLVTSDDINQKCSASCNDACVYSLYSITTEVIDDIGEQLCEENDIHCKHQVLVIKVSFSRLTVQTFKHEPKFQSVELFSYIGGYMGMWLGISLVSLFDFVEMILDVLAYPVIKWKKTRKRGAHVRVFDSRSYTMY